MSARLRPLTSGPQSAATPLPPRETTPSLRTVLVMIRMPQLRLDGPCLRAAPLRARHPYPRAVAGSICKSPYHRPPPPTTRGLYVLSCLASADRNPTQNARRPLSDALAYAGHQSPISCGTMLTKGSPCALRAEIALRVQRSVPLKCAQRVLGMWPSLMGGATSAPTASCAEATGKEPIKIRQIAIGFTRIALKRDRYQHASRRMISPASPPRRQNFG